jgi:hypothetical protein
VSVSAALLSTVPEQHIARKKEQEAQCSYNLGYSGTLCVPFCLQSCTILSESGAAVFQ